MQTYVMIAGIIIAAIGQKLNASPNIPSWAVKTALTVCGAVLYLVIDRPDAMNVQAFLDWLDAASMWALALPGVASLIGLAPGMATKNGGSTNA